MKKITLLVLCFLMIKADAQDTTQSFITPEGIFDSVYDKDGRLLSLKDLMIDNFDTKNLNKVNAINSYYSAPKIVECSGSYYRLYFETGWFNGSNATNELLAQNTICQVFQDLSKFIRTPLTNNGGKVNILVQSIYNTDVSLSILGGATPFYVVPLATNNTYSGGIVDNTAWFKIVTGKSAFTNITIPIYADDNSAKGDNVFFDGKMTFNFNAPWNFRLDTVAKATEFDLYSTVMHEICHTLGFASLILPNKNSLLDKNQYGRYDQNLVDSLGVKLLSQNPSNISMYAYKNKYVANSSNTTTNTTICSSAFRYKFKNFTPATVPVYTPKLFEKGSSLSHFEDMCYCPTSFTNSCNNQYFTMAESGSLGLTKRYLQKEERQVLVDLKYRVDTVFGSATNLNFKTYATTIIDSQVIYGLNDGIKNGAFVYTTFLNKPVVIHQRNAPYNIFENDTSLAFIAEGLQAIYGTGTFSDTLGFRYTNSKITYTPTAKTGIHLLRYVPYNNTSLQRGNITYIYVMVLDTSCSSNTLCNIVKNGNFEEKGLNYLPACWQLYDIEGATPDYFYLTKGLNGKPYKFNIPDSMNTPPNAPYNWNYGIADTQNINQSYMGLMAQHAVSRRDTTKSNIWQNLETISTYLTAPITPKKTYRVKFKAKVANYTRYPNPAKFEWWTFANKDVSVHLSVSDVQLVAPLHGTILPIHQGAKIFGNIKVKANGQWNSIDTLITSDSSITNHPFLYVSNGAYFDYTTPPLDSTYPFNSYIYLDEFEIIPFASSLKLPVASLCVGDTIKNLRQYITPYNSAGIITGNGITKRLVSNDTIYDFVARTTNIGTQIITYSYVEANGCPTTSTPFISVVNTKPKVDSIVLKCATSQIILEPFVKNGVSYFWTNNTNAKIDDSVSAIIYTIPTTNTTYYLKVSNACGFTSDSFKAVYTNSIWGDSILCVGDSLKLNSFASGGKWQSLQPSIATINNNGVVKGIAIGKAKIKLVYQKTCGLKDSVYFWITVGNGSLPVIIGQNNICFKDSANFRSPTIGGVWSLSDTNHAIIKTNGWLIPKQLGSDTVFYTLKIGNCVTKALLPITIRAKPTKPLIKDTLVNYCIGDPNTPSFDSLVVLSSISNGNSVGWVDNSGNFTTAVIATNLVNSATYSAVQFDSFGCVSEATKPITINVVNCKPSCLNGNTYTVIDGANGVIRNITYTGLCYLKNNVVFDGAVVFNNAEVVVDSGASITLLDEQELLISSSHFFTCNAMWKGINVGVAAKLTVQGVALGDQNYKSSLIEDAEVAINYRMNRSIDLGFDYSLNVSNTIFNRNNIGISINNIYEDANGNIPLAFYVSNSVFTCRDIRFNIGLQNWPNVDVLKNTNLSTAVNYPNTPKTLSSPYINTGIYSATNSNAYLKDSARNNKPQHGIKLTEIGNFDYSNSSYIGITIGNANKTVFNDNRTIFDNIINPISCNNANTTVNNCVFQNGVVGIEAGSTVNYYELTVNNALNNSPNNAFFNMYQAVDVQGYRKVKINQCDIRSTKGLNGIYSNGGWGIVVSGTKYDNLDINNNEIINLNNGITVYNNNATPNPNTNTYTSGAINVNNNNILAELPNATPLGVEYVEKAITLSSELMYDENYDGDETILNCNNNTINTAYFGIDISNWNNKTTIVNNNRVILANIPNVGLMEIEQFGIRLIAGKPSTVGIAEQNTLFNNWVTGSCNSCHQTGILLANQETTNLGCNYVENNLHGFRFYNRNDNTMWRDNFMNPTNQFGITLDEQGEIGKQGSTGNKKSCTSNNNWMTNNNGWQAAGNHFKTNVERNSDATLSTLFVDITNPAFNPDDPNYIPSGFGSLPYSINNGSIQGTINTPGINCNRCVLDSTLADALAELGVRNMQVNIANGTVPIPTADSVQRLYVMQEQLFERLRHEAFINGSIPNPTLNNFVQNNSMGSFDFIYYTQKYIAQKDKASVEILLDYFPSNNPVDDNYFQYFSWQAKMLDSPNVKPNLSQLYNLATKCPLTAGKVVYAARNMYNRLTKQNIKFVNTCDNTLSPARQQMANQTKRNIPKELPKASIYPNPSSGVVNIKLEFDAKNKYLIKVFDVFGKIILEKNSLNLINTLDFHGHKGIYFINLINKQSGLTQIEKLIMQ